jgi:hypothetical protein
MQALAARTFSVFLLVHCSLVPILHVMASLGCHKSDASKLPYLRTHLGLVLVYAFAGMKSHIIQAGHVFGSGLPIYAKEPTNALT